mmetsp:Transcript_27560/g.40705  ORF Transcript_27560/g.40705 Transcript_27560/m.40705 type:complete len:83 (+) Transcript_27560:91-339(+)
MTSSSSSSKKNIGLRIVFIAIGILGVLVSVHMINQVQRVICSQSLLKENFELGHNLFCQQRTHEEVEKSSALRGIALVTPPY